MGVDLTGKIALVRYGKIFRGLKVMFAQERGMVGVIIYSDPADDGFSKGTVFPDGPWRNAVAVQRGSVQVRKIFLIVVIDTNCHNIILVLAIVSWRSKVRLKGE